MKVNILKKYTTTKVDADFMKEMKELAKFRYFKNLEKKEPSFPEMTRLARRTLSWQGVKNELSTKPRKENIK
jgi:hypothetical protein